MDKKQYILGCLFGDAFIYTSKVWRAKINKSIDWYALHLNSVDSEFIEFFKSCLISCNARGKLNILFDKSKVKNWKDQYHVETQDQIFIKDMLNLKANFNYDKDITFDFLRGLIDSEGCMNVNYKSHDSGINFVSTNKSLMLGCKKYMEKQGFTNLKWRIDARKGRKKVYEIYLSTYPNLKLFNEKIGFTIKRKQIKLDNVLKVYEEKFKKAQIYFKVIEMKKSGCTIPFICKELNLSEGTVIGWIYAKSVPFALKQNI